MFVYNIQSKKTSSSAYWDSADVKIWEEDNLLIADQHLSNLQHPPSDTQILDVNPAALPGLSIYSAQLLTSSDRSRFLQKHCRRIQLCKFQFSKKWEQMQKKRECDWDLSIIYFAFLELRLFWWFRDFIVA